MSKKNPIEFWQPLKKEEINKEIEKSARELSEDFMILLRWLYDSYPEILIKFEEKIGKKYKFEGRS